LRTECTFCGRRYNDVLSGSCVGCGAGEYVIVAPEGNDTFSSYCSFRVEILGGRWFYADEMTLGEEFQLR